MSTDPDLTEETDDIEEADYEDEEVTEGASDDQVSSQDGQALLLAVASDPEIQAVLRARREGKTVKVTEGEGEGDDEETETSDPFSDLEDDDLKKLATLLDKRLDAKVGAITDRVSGLESVAQGYEAREVHGQIEEIAKKHKDFPKFRKAMSELARSKGKGLSVEELYALAKLQAGELDLREPSTDSEKPTPTPRRRAAKAKKTASRMGRKGWNSILADSLDELDLSAR